MAKTALELTPQEWGAYRPAEAIKQRQSEISKDIRKLRREALDLAHRAAEIPKEDFNAEKVVLFGSLAGNYSFTRWSDIDLAAWGIPSSLFYEAVGAIIGMSSKFKIDLVDPDSCRPGLKEVIEKAGVEL
jgi:predicted nucleotidyltransferase